MRKNYSATPLIYVTEVAFAFVTTLNLLVFELLVHSSSLAVHLSSMNENGSIEVNHMY